MAGNLIPADLNIKGYPDPSDKNYFDVKTPGLLPNTGYGFQFQWVFDDGTTSDWSATKTVLTTILSAPGEPQLDVTDVVGGQGVIIVKWGGKDTSGQIIPNVSRVDIHISGGKFGDGTAVTDSFLTTGTKSIASEAGTYYVQLKAVGADGKTVSVFSQVRTVVVTGTSIVIEDSKTPSIPTVSSVLGAIQLTWDGKQADGSNQPKGFDAAKVYVGTTSNFVPGPTNQVDKLNFANGQNTLAIGVGTPVNGVPMDYGIDYYVKIATTNGTDTSTPVSATGNPVRVGQVKNGDIVEILADKISTGTLKAGSTITVGAPGGKRIELKGTGDPFAIYGTGGQSLLSYSGEKLTVVGDGTFSGDISGAYGTFTGGLSIGSYFSVTSTGIITATSGTIGGLTLSAQSIGNVGDTFKIDKDGIITVGPASGNHIQIKASGSDGGIVHMSGSSPSNNFTLTNTGTLQLGSSSGTDYLSWTGSSLAIKSSNVSIYGSTDSSLVVNSSGVTLVGRDRSSAVSDTWYAYAAASKIILDQSGVQIFGLPYQNNADIAYRMGSDGYRQSAGGQSLYPLGAVGRQRMVVERPETGRLEMGMAVYYRASGNSDPGASSGVVGDLWVVY
jgi:hypothetical protein